MEADKVIIHVRFMPNGSVSEIGERPAEQHTAAMVRLSELKAGDHYQALAGGRGVFRLIRNQMKPQD